MTWLCPEVVQTSAMDCGPAALKCLLEGFGVSVSYGRLREACQTAVDGSSIDTLEEVARELGLDAEQVLSPADCVLEAAADALPAIAIVRVPSGLTHFVVAWRRHGPLVQVMDPASGRRWMRAATFERDLFRHSMPLPVDAWRDWITVGQGRDVLAARLARLGVSSAEGEGLIAGAAAQPGWRPLAALEAAVRTTLRLRRLGALGPGGVAASVLRGLLDREGAAIPRADWTAAEAPPDDDGSPRVHLTGAVLVRIRGRLEASAAAPSLAPELAAALAEAPARPARDLLRLLRADGYLRPAAALGALALASLGAVVEVVVFRRLVDLGRSVESSEPRRALAGAALWLLIGLLLVRLPVLAGVLGIGRRLETRLRAAFLAKLPRLEDRYLSSRPTSDMASRSHELHQLRTLPQLAQSLVATTVELAVTAAGLIWLAPRGAPAAVAAALIEIALPFLLMKPLAERDLRVRTHDGALAQFYLDALLGLTAVRTHGAERAFVREHASLLGEWRRAVRSFLHTSVGIEAVQALVGLAVGALVLARYVATGADAAGALLLAHWALGLPVLGQELALAARQYPLLRNLTLRLVEPLGARERADVVERDADGAQVPAAPTPVTEGAALALHAATVVAAGHTVLDGVDLEIPPGAHVAVVGASGAGKSTLAGLFLGWHRAQGGEVLVDGRPLDAAALERLRRQTAWVDPAVQLWNRSLVENLRYGASVETGSPDSKLDDVLDAAELRDVLARLPAGLATPLGEGGGLVSGGEGQRIRLGRALQKRDARLVILDEAFRGLERTRRRSLYAAVRAHWPRATILCITHDLAETLEFPRVLVVDGGRIVEDAAPATLMARASRFRSLLDAEGALAARVWRNELFRHVEVAGGRVRERAPEGDRRDG